MINKEIAKNIYKSLKPYIGYEILGFSVIIIATFLGLLKPYIIKDIIDNSIKNGDLNSFFQNILIIIVIFIIVTILNIIRTFLFAYVKQKLNYDFRMKFYRNISHKNISFYSNIHTGELMNRILKEIPIITNFLSDTFISILTQVFIFIFTFFIMFSINKFITIVSLLITPFIYLLLKYYNPKIKEYNSLLMQKNSKISDILQENLTNIRVIKYLNTYKYAEKRFSKSLHSYIKEMFSFIRLKITSNNILSLIYFIPSIFVLSYGGYLVIEGRLSVGSIVALNTYISRLYSPIQKLTQINLNLQKTKAAFNRYYNIVNEDIRNQKNNNYNKLNECIKLIGISYYYSKDDWLINNLNLEIQLGEKLLIKGTNGIGKSTLIDLISGLIQPKDGFIKYDDMNVNNININKIKKIISVVPQSTYIFNDTIYNNICLGKKFSMKKINQLIKELGIEKINLKKEINDNDLSGGEKQKIIILRALIREHQVLILDEPFKFLDEISIKKISKYLSNNIDNKILIFISHKSDIGINFDKILDLDEEHDTKLCEFINKESIREKRQAK